MRRSRPRSSAREPVYGLAIVVGRLLFGGLLRLRPVVSGTEHIPLEGGAVLAITHFGYADFALVEWVTWLRLRRRIRFLTLRSAFEVPLVGAVLRAMRHVPVDRAHGQAAYAPALAALRAGELVGVFPEAGVSASFTVRELKTGAARLAAEAAVPLVPVVVWGGQLVRTKGHRMRLREAYRAPIVVEIGAPEHPAADDDPVESTERLRSALQSRLDAVQAAYPLPGRGQWWQPRHLGGSAPTPEEAAALDAERRRRKAGLHA